MGHLGLAILWPLPMVPWSMFPFTPMAPPPPLLVVSPPHPPRCLGRSSTLWPLHMVPLPLTPWVRRPPRLPAEASRPASSPLGSAGVCVRRWPSSTGRRSCQQCQWHVAGLPPSPWRACNGKAQQGSKSMLPRPPPWGEALRPPPLPASRLWRYAQPPHPWGEASCDAGGDIWCTRNRVQAQQGSKSMLPCPPRG
jgi:hypothetical protein